MTGGAGGLAPMDPACVDLSTRLGSLALPNPVLTASGCAAAGRELDAFVPVSTIGAVVTKSIMLAPRSGRATPRMVETASGMLNSIGLQGPGIEHFVARDLPWLRARGARVVVSIAGTSIEEYALLAQRLRQAGPIAAVEVNISCPNLEDRGQVFACNRSAAMAVVHAVRRATDPATPVLAKLSPDVTDLVDIADGCVNAGADGLAMINTTLGLAIDPTSMRPALAGVTGGLSGPAIRPIAMRCIWQVHRELPDVPILGMGGLRTGLDVVEMVLAGASAVSVGTVVFHDPSAPQRILAELRDVLAERGIGRLRDLVGYAHRPPDERARAGELPSTEHALAGSHHQEDRP